MSVTLTLKLRPRSYTRGKPVTHRTYDPRNVTITFNGIEIKGYADGDFFEFDRDDVIEPGKSLGGMIDDLKVRLNAHQHAMPLTILLGKAP